jgi:putative transposase
MSVYGRADHRDLARAGGRCEDRQGLPQARHQRRYAFKWEAKYGGLEVSDATQLKGLEDENAKLKKLLAGAMFDNAVFKDIASKNGDARRKAGSRRSPTARI